jgi:hypothetical protein
VERGYRRVSCQRCRTARLPLRSVLFCQLANLSSDLHPVSNNPHVPPENDNPEHGNVFRGYDLESGLLTRVREWPDVFPWIRLGRTLRAAASPTLIALTSLAFAIWCGGNEWLESSPQAATSDVEIAANGLSGRLNELQQYLQSLIATTSIRTESTWWLVAELLWSILIWTPVALLLSRQGALLTAGRTMVGFRQGLSLSLQRTPAGWLAAIVPLACTIMIGLMILVVGWVAKISGGITFIATAFSIIAVLIGIPCGVLAFGSNVAVPLSWAALANEPDPDALDSLSRGYEYLFRRPLQLVLYVIVSMVILGIVGLLATGIAEAASAVTQFMLGWGGSPEGVTRAVQAIYRQLPFVGGVYLLLRYDAGGQEVEDIWRPTPVPALPLPKLPKP